MKPRILTQVEVELQFAKNILENLNASLIELDRWWAPSKRGVNAQRTVAELRMQQKTALKCIKDALAAYEEQNK